MVTGENRLVFFNNLVRYFCLNVNSKFEKELGYPLSERAIWNQRLGMNLSRKIPIYINTICLYKICKLHSY